MTLHFPCLWCRLPLVARLMLAVTATFTLAALVTMYFVAHYAASNTRSELTSEYQRQLDLIALLIPPGLLGHEPERVKTTLSYFHRSPGVIKVGFRSASDTIEFSRETAVTLTAPQWFARWCAVHQPGGTRPLQVDGTYIGQISLELSPIPSINQAWERIEQQLLILVTMLSLVLTAIWMVVRNGLKPLQVLAEGAQALRHGDFSLRLTPRGSPELRSSIDGFNCGMAFVERLVGEIQANTQVLLRSEQSLRVTLQSIGDAVIATDAEGRITMMNAVAEELTGWPLEDALGQPVTQVFRIINEESRNTVESPVAIVLREGRIVGLANHTLLVARDGNEKPIADSGAPIRISADGEIIGVVLVFRDQTEEHRYLNSLRESEQLYASLANASPAGIFRVDVDGRLVYANDNLRTIFRGKLSEQTYDWSDEVVVHPDDHSRVWGQWATVLQNAGNFQSRHRVLRPDGSMIWINMRASPLRDAHEHLVGFVGTVVDITAEQAAIRKIEHLSHLYATLSGINNAIVHSSDPATLFSEICRVIHQVGGYAAAWLVLNDDESHTMSLGAFAPAAAGQVAPLLAGMRLEPDDPSAQTLIGRTLLSGERQVSNNYRADLQSSPFYANVKALGGSSVLCVPVSLESRTVAAIVFVAGEKNYFSEEMIALADETAGDISFALANFERERSRRRIEDKLRDNEERLRLALGASQQGTYEIDLTKDRVLIDAACAAMLGLQPEAREMSAADYLALSRVAADLPTLIAGRLGDQDAEAYCTEAEHLVADGERRWLQWSGAVVAWTPEHTPARLLGTVSDISERHTLEEHLHMTAMLFENSKDSIIIADADARIVAANRAFTEITGYSLEEVIGQHPRRFKSGCHDAAFYADLWREMLDVGYWQGEIWNRRKSGDIYPCQVTLYAVRRPDGKPTHFLWLATDISKQKEFEERITRLAYRDALTDLPNRTLLRDRVEQILAAAERDEESLAMLFLDLDHFKNINDSLGHSVGDRLLIEVARRMLMTVREMDTVGRLGGDEFLIILPGADADAAAHVAQKLLTQVAQSFLIDEHTLTVTPSIGVSLFPKDGRSFDDLMKSADTAMYKAKEMGRNACYFASSEMNHAVLRRLVLEGSLRRAIDDKEFILFYQPQYQIAGQHLVGIEALIRWQRPESGFVPPGDFIPVAEDSGLIEPIGAWVLGEACRQIKRWLDENLPVVRVGVNFSTRQFASRNLVAVVDQALEESGLSGEFLEVEITESLLAGDMDYLLTVLRALKDRGLHISVDDFGTGYSSLSYLKRFPIDRLKIDRSFVRDLVSDADDRAIASTVVTLGHSLGMKVIAEGVETAEQFRILQEMGCDEAQGFFLARPMPSSDLAAFLRKEGVLAKYPRRQAAQAT